MECSTGDLNTGWDSVHPKLWEENAFTIKDQGLSLLWHNGEQDVFCLLTGRDGIKKRRQLNHQDLIEFLVKSMKPASFVGPGTASETFLAGRPGALKNHNREQAAHIPALFPAVLLTPLVTQKEQIPGVFSSQRSCTPLQERKEGKGPKCM